MGLFGGQGQVMEEFWWGAVNLEQGRRAGRGMVREGPSLGPIVHMLQC